MSPTMHAPRRKTCQALLPDGATPCSATIAASMFFLSGCASAVSARMVASRSGYFISRCTGLMSSEGRSHACERFDASVRVCARYAVSAGVCGSFSRCSIAVGCFVMYVR